MTALTETALYWMARCLYSSEVAHSDEMKAAVSDRERHSSYRASLLDRILTAAECYQVTIEGKELVDLGCNDGSLTLLYMNRGAASVVGVDIDESALELARRRHAHRSVDYRLGTVSELPLEECAVDVVICFDVFEHVSRPAEILRECHRILRPGGKMLIGTWGWGHPFAPHLWHTIPVPWAHVFFSERTVLRTSRRVYRSSWYRPNMHDFGPDGERLTDKYLEESISSDYLNKYYVRDFEKVFEQSGLHYRVHLEPFGSRWARWTSRLLGNRRLREYLHSYLWAVLTKQESTGRNSKPT